MSIAFAEIAPVSAAEKHSSRHSPGVSIIIPVFNEQEAVVPTILELARCLCHYDGECEMIVINDGSTDETREALAEVSRMVGLRIIEHPRNLGYGAALKTGIRYARQPLVAIVDADGSYPIERLTDLLAQARHADMVVGARVGPRVVQSWPRRFAKSCLLRFAEWLTRREIPDLNSGMRVFRRDVAEQFLRILPDGFSFTTTITLSMLTKGYRVHFEPIDYHKRIGQSKIRPLQDTLNFAQLILRTAIYFAPIRVFLPVAALFFLAFLSALGWDVLVRRDLTEGTLILLTASTQLALFALLADMIDKRGS
jgi:glycosyltransferase involved in cell wall biosynthesis